MNNIEKETMPTHFSTNIVASFLDHVRRPDFRKIAEASLAQIDAINDEIERVGVEQQVAAAEFDNYLKIHAEGGADDIYVEECLASLARIEAKFQTIFSQRNEINRLSSTLRAFLNENRASDCQGGAVTLP